MEMEVAVLARYRLDDYLKELHLPTVRACYEEVAGQAVREPLTHTEFLLTLLERECEVRCQNRIERRLRESRLPLEKSLESFDLKRLPAKVPAERKYGSAAQRQAAYRLRLKNQRLAEMEREELPPLPPIPSMPGRRRWEAMTRQALCLVEQVAYETQTYYNQRSEAWQESERGEAFLETMELVAEVAAALTQLPQLRGFEGHFHAQKRPSEPRFFHYIS